MVVSQIRIHTKDLSRYLAYRFSKRFNFERPQQRGILESLEYFDELGRGLLKYIWRMRRDNCIGVSRVKYSSKGVEELHEQRGMQMIFGFIKQDN